MNPKHAVIWHKIEAITKEMAHLSVLYQMPRLIIDTKTGQITIESFWTNESARETYDQYLALLAELRKIIDASEGDK